MGQATGCSGRYENHFDFQSVGLSFSCPALVTGKAKRVEPVPSSKGIKKAPASLYRGFRSAPVVSSKGSLPRRSDAIPKHKSHKWLSKKCRSLSKKVEFGQTFVQKLLVELGCRMSQRRDDFFIS